MKSIQILSNPLLSSSGKDKNKKGKKIILEESKSNTDSFSDTKMNNQISNAISHECKEEEMNNFDMCFFLSKDLIEKIENEDEPENIRNNDEYIIPQDNKSDQSSNLFNHLKNQDQFHFNLSQNNEKVEINENTVNPVNQYSNLNNNYFQYPNFDFQSINIFKKDLSKYYVQKKIGCFTLKMFGKIGWICRFCDNFNYLERKKCNRCHQKKHPKNIQSLFSDSADNKKNDWICSCCGNLNFYFREICNRCQKHKNSKLLDKVWKIFF